MTDDQARRNRQMGDWIRQGISAPSMPLELPPPEPDDPGDGVDATASPVRPPSGVDAGAGTSNAGRGATQRESMNDLIRRTVRQTRHGPLE